MRAGSRAGLAGAADLSRLPASIRTQEMSWKKYAVAMLLFNVVGFLGRLSAAATAGRLAAQSAAASRPTARISSFNTAVSFATNTNWQGYGGETTMSYLSQMLGADGAELRLGGDRHGRAGGVDSRLGAAHGARRSATSGSTWCASRSTSCCRCRSSWRWSWCRKASCRTSSRTRRRRWCSRSTGADGKPVTEADAADGAGRVADRHQATGHQRRRLLQRQLGASVRESDAAVELSSNCWRSW